MKKTLLKPITLSIILFASLSVFAQESYDFTSLDCSSIKYTSSKSSLTCGENENGFKFTNFTDNFFELRINGATTQGQNRVVINFTNSSNADGVTFKSSSTALEGGAITNLGTSSVEAVFSDANFSNGGDIQLRSRFLNKAGNTLTGSVLITSLVVDNQGVLGVDDVFARTNTTITVKDNRILVKNAPQGSSLNIYNLSGQSVDNNRLSYGAYIVKLSVENSTMTKKIFIF